jgi:hypothetical protein
VSPEITMSSMVAATDDAVSTEVSGEAVILHLEDGVYFGLNEVGSRVWSLVTEPTRVDRVCVVIEREYDVGSATCRRDVLRLLGELADHDLVRIVE